MSQDNNLMKETQKKHGTHKWNGWPGACCMKCGIDDPIEFAIGTCYNPCNNSWDTSHPQYEEAKKACEELKICSHFNGKDPYET